ncbi:MAG TPA: thioesterase family protein, partial [Bacillales bacterium]|nr:thioesterase family protein [Bacillales bacterium]
GETDLLGHVNNANYFSYLEHARVKFVQSLDGGENYNGWQFILATIKCDFVAQTYFDQNLTIATKVSRIGNSSFTLVQPIYDSETRELVAEGESVMVYFDFEEQKSKPLPEMWRKQLAKYLIQAEEEHSNA